jgi:hypothetical protein
MLLLLPRAPRGARMQRMRHSGQHHTALCASAPCAPDILTPKGFVPAAHTTSPGSRLNGTPHWGPCLVHTSKEAAQLHLSIPWTAECCRQALAPSTLTDQHHSFTTVPTPAPPSLTVRRPSLTITVTPAQPTQWHSCSQVRADLAPTTHGILKLSSNPTKDQHHSFTTGPSPALSCPAAPPQPHTCAAHHYLNPAWHSCSQAWANHQQHTAFPQSILMPAG